MNKELLVAYSVLKKVYLSRAYASIELNKALNVNKDKCNTALITKIVYGVLEKDVSLEYIIAKHVQKRPDEALMVILKMGAYVNAFINSIPNYTCVYELVEITKKYESKFLSGFVNATLKKIISEKPSLPSRRNIVEYYSVRYSYPAWMVELLLKNFPEQFVVDLLSFKLTTKTHIRVVPQVDRLQFLADLKEKNIEVEKSVFDDTFYVEYDELLKHKNLNASYTVQGVPSIIVCRQEKSVEKVLDVCASPGGKSICLAGLHENSSVLSCDKTESRVDLVKSYANRFGLKNIDYCVHDATEFNPDWEGKFDLVLADVPCSNLGVIGKKPDVMLNKTADDIVNLVELQKKIIANASKYVAVNGYLIYSTCSILKEENDNIVEQFLKDNKNFKSEAVDSFGVNVSKSEWGITFYPHISGVEGFFIGRMKRKI